MGLRNPGRLAIPGWRGLDTFAKQHEVAPDQWFEALNVIVDSSGAAAALRSPAAFGDPLTDFDSSDSSESSSSVDDPIISMDEYRRAAGHLLFVDKGVDTYSVDSTGVATGVRSGQAGDPWTSVNANDRLQRIDGNEFIQYLTSLAHYRNGIDAPTLAPTISYTADDSSDSFSESCEIETSLQVSYAYKNTTTGHIGEASPISNVLGPTSDDLTLRVPVVASTQPGVDKIVFFITLDGGSIPYLALECGTSTVYEVSNSSGNADIPLCAYDVDTLTPETIYNAPPPTDATHLFGWKDRLVLVRGRFIQYSGFESAYAGNPYECWPPRNQMMLPNRSDVCVSGIATNLGALIFGKEDSYIISGYPSDKVSSPNNTVAVTEHMEQLKWGIGIYANGKDTPVTTPFGTMWVDQNKKLRLWTMKEFPTEIGVPLRNELLAMTGTITGTWHQHADNAGYYVIRNATTVLIMVAYQNAEGQLRFGYAKSDVETAACTVVNFSTPGFFFGLEDQVYRWLDLDTAGDGWAAGTEIYFKTILGNDGNFSHFHSLSIEGTNVNQGFTFLVNDELIVLENDIDADTSYYGLVDQEARRHRLEFRWNRDDTYPRTIDALQIFMKKKSRII